MIAISILLFYSFESPRNSGYVGDVEVLMTWIRWKDVSSIMYSGSAFDTNCKIYAVQKHSKLLFVQWHGTLIAQQGCSWIFPKQNFRAKSQFCIV